MVDYTQEDFTKNGEQYDIIFDTVGRSSFSKCRASLTGTGCYLPTTGLANYFLMVWTSLRGGPRVVSGMSVEKNAALEFLRNLVEAGGLRIVIDQCFPLEQAVEAHRYVEKGHKTGNVVISVRG